MSVVRCCEPWPWLTAECRAKQKTPVLSPLRECFIQALKKEASHVTVELCTEVFFQEAY